MFRGRPEPDERPDGSSDRERPRGVTRRTVLRGTATAALGSLVFGAGTGRGRASHDYPVTWTRTTVDADDASETFGRALALDDAGETLVVGDPMRTEGDTPYGGVSVYVDDDDDGWTREALLRPDYRARFDMVGASVAVDAAGETIAVGVSGEDGRASQCGALSIYARRDGSWTHVQRLFADDAGVKEYLGTTVAIDDAGERVLAGAPGRAADEGAGAAYVFDRDESDDDDEPWEQTKKLTLSDGSSEALAGTGLSLSGDGQTAMVGAPGVDDGAGAVAVFTDEPWSEVSTVENVTDGATAFGWSLVTNGTDALVGAPAPSEGGSGSDSDGGGGPAAATGELDLGVWRTNHQLTPENGPDGERFGIDLDVAGDGDNAVVSAVFDGTDSSDGDDEDGSDEDAVQSGGAYVFVDDEGEWKQTHRLAPADSDAVRNFGQTVAVDKGDTVAVAGQRVDSDATSGDGSTDEASTAATGTVTVFRRESPDVSMDIEPDEEWPATVPYEGTGEVEVAVNHTDEFDPANVDVETLRFGPPRVVDEGEGARPIDGGEYRDTDGNGEEDLVVRFRAEDAEFAGDDFAARLTGETIHGTPFSEHDFVMTVSGDDESENGSDEDDDSGDGDGDNGGDNGGDDDGSSGDGDNGGDDDGSSGDGDNGDDGDSDDG